MKIMLRSFVVVALLCASGIAIARSLVLIEDRVVPITGTSGKAPSLDAVKKAIITGAVAKGWVPADQGSGKLKLDIDVRGKHKVGVQVLYTPTSYTIKYLSSENMKEGDGMIHPQYNNWINNLVQSISAQLAII